jgi:hypothetical protein
MARPTGGRINTACITVDYPPEFDRIERASTQRFLDWVESPERQRAIKKQKRQ